MNKKIGLVLALIITYGSAVFSAAPELAVITKAQYEEYIQESRKNSAEVWKLVDQDDQTYVIERRRGLHSLGKFALDKKQVHIRSSSEHLPVVLKFKDIEWIQ